MHIKSQVLICKTSGTCIKICLLCLRQQRGRTDTEYKTYYYSNSSLEGEVHAFKFICMAMGCNFKNLILQKLFIFLIIEEVQRVDLSTIFIKYILIISCKYVLAKKWLTS